MTTSLLKELENKDPHLFAHYRNIASQAVQGFQKYGSSLGQWIDFGEQHNDKILKLIELLLPPAMKQVMLPEEIHLLLCAIELHNIGLLAEKESYEKLQSILIDYPERTYDYIYSYHTDWGLSHHQAYFLQQICMGLNTHYFRDLSPVPGTLQVVQIRTKFLAALLRLGSALDVDHTRVSQYALQLRKLSPESMRHWLRFTAVQGIEVDSKRWRIVVYVLPETIEGQQILQEFVEGKLQEELNIVQETFDANSLHYRLIEMELAYGKKLKVEHIVAALKQFYNLSQKSKQPYKFLDYFNPSDKNIFFGREADVARFKGYIGTQKLIVLYGESGVGKTSLIRAGLIPHLIENGYVPVYTRCIDEPDQVIRDATEELIQRFDKLPTAYAQASLQLFFQHLCHQGYELVIFIDQFEEFFIRFPESVRQTFIDDLIDCLSEDIPLHVTFVLALRREYVIELGNYKTRLLELFNNAYEVRLLTREEVKEAIIKPAREHGYLYEETLVEEIVNDIYHEGEFNTPHIQIVCDKLITSLEPQTHMITHSLYHRLGGALKILAGYLEVAINRLPPEEQTTATDILKDMVTSRRTKSVSNTEEIARRTGHSLETVRILLYKLIHEARLVREIKRSGNVLYELAHEFLVEKVGEWVHEEDVRKKAIYEMLDRQLIEWERGFLLDMDRLNTVNEMRDILSLGNRHKQLILESYLKNAPHSPDKWFWLQLLEPALIAEVAITTFTTSDSIVYQETINTLIQLGKDIIEPLINGLGSPNWKIRQGIISVLQGIGVSTIPLIIPLLDHYERRTRRSVIEILGYIGNEALPLLHKSWEDKSVNTRNNVLECLITMGSKEAKQLLRVLANSHGLDERTQSRIQFALTQWT